MLLALAATVTAGLQGGAAVGELSESAALDQISDHIGDWRGEDRPVPEKVRELLTYDAVLRRTYRNRVGQEVEVWVIFWTTRNAVKGYHHPDVCFPNRGWHCTDGGNRAVELDADTTVPVTIRRYEREGSKQLVTYWTQEGRRVWTSDDEKAVQMAGDSHRWIGDRLTLRGRYEGSARLAVLLGTDLWGGYAEKALAEFTEGFAAELYRACPWARPEPPPAP
jgi:EpsI family protein